MGFRGKVGKSLQKDENYKLLKEGKVGGNLIYKYKSRSVIAAKKNWIDFISNQIQDILTKRSEKNNFVGEIRNLNVFCNQKLKGMLDAEANTSTSQDEFQYDVLKWIHDGYSKKLSFYKLAKPKKYVFEYTEEQLKNRVDLFKRYGTDINALSKIMTRVSNLEVNSEKLEMREKIL